MFRQMGCSGLRKLRVAVTDKVRPEELGPMKDMLASIELDELANLEELVVDFPDFEPGGRYGPGWPMLGFWTGAEAWEPLEIACAARNIACIIRYPQQALPAGRANPTVSFVAD
jgi:hypothetical protein